MERSCYKFVVSYNDGSLNSGGGGFVTKEFRKRIPVFNASVPTMRKSEYVLGSTDHIEARYDRCATKVSESISPSISPSSLRLDSTKVGNYKLTSIWEHEGSGVTQRKTTVLDFKIIGRAPDHVALIEGINRRDELLQISFPGKPINWISYFRLESNLANSPLEDLDLREGRSEFLHGYKVNGSNVNTSVRVSFPDLVHVKACIANPVAGINRLWLKHSPTNSTANDDIPFVSIDPRASVNRAVSKKNVTSQIIGPKNTKNSLCTASSILRFPFASGDGSKNNPYLACTKTQFYDGTKAVIDQAVQSEKYHLYFKLGDNIDFENQKIQPFEFYREKKNSNSKTIYHAYLNGDDYNISNAVMVDAERSKQALYDNLAFAENVGLSGFTVKGKQLVGTLCVVCYGMKHVSIINSTVVGEYFTGGIGAVADENSSSTEANSLEKLFTKNVTVSGYKTKVGGFFGQLELNLKESIFEGRIQSIGVPGLSASYGGGCW